MCRFTAETLVLPMSLEKVLGFVNGEGRLGGAMLPLNFKSLAFGRTSVISIILGKTVISLTGKFGKTN